MSSVDDLTNNDNQTITMVNNAGVIQNKEVNVTAQIINIDMNSIKKKNNNCMHCDVSTREITHKEENAYNTIEYENDACYMKDCNDHYLRRNITYERNYTRCPISNNITRNLSNIDGCRGERCSFNPIYIHPMYTVRKVITTENSLSDTIFNKQRVNSIGRELSDVDLHSNRNTLVFQDIDTAKRKENYIANTRNCYWLSNLEVELICSITLWFILFYLCIFFMSNYYF